MMYPNDNPASIGNALTNVSRNLASLLVPAGDINSGEIPLRKPWDLDAHG